jgi:hypothetical protein
MAARPIFFTCPTTRQKVPTGVEMDVQSLQALWNTTLKVDCLCCGAAHEISIREAYLDSALADASELLDRGAEGPMAQRS